MDLSLTLVVIADSGGISAAANRLGRTQSAVSLQIKRLEEAIGQSLLERRQGRVVGHTADGRLRQIQLGKLTLQFKLTAPSKLYWAGRPAMRVMQALYWLRDGLKGGAQIDQDAIQAKLIRLLQDSSQGSAIRDDLRSGLHTVPSWMQQWIRDLLAQSEQASTKASP
jgi:hypothetical protein